MIFSDEQKSGAGESGSATVEFAIIAPVLILAVLATADIGFAIHESFEVDHAIRNGAEAAINDPGEARVCSVLASVDTRGGDCPGAWRVSRYHVCPENPDARTSESRTCANNRPTSIYYDIVGVRAYSGILLPSRDLSRSASIQVR